MYRNISKGLLIALSSISILGLSGPLQAEEAKAEESTAAATEKQAPQLATEPEKAKPAAAPAGSKPSQMTVRSPYGPPPGYYPPNRQSSRPIVWPDEVQQSKQAQRQQQRPSQQAQQPKRPPQPQQVTQAPVRPQQSGPYGPPPGYNPNQVAPMPAGPQAGPGYYGPPPGYYPGGNYYQPYPYRRSSNNWMPWSGDWSSDDMMPWSSSSGKKKKMPWQGLNKNSQPWNKDEHWDKMPWNWNLDNAPWNNWEGDGRMKDGEKYYKRGRNKKKANVTWD